MNPPSVPPPVPALSRLRRTWWVAGVAVAVAAAGAAGLFWVTRPMPVSAPPFVFRDGFEGAEKLADLFPRDRQRWHGVQRETGARAPSNLVALSTERVHAGANALKCVAGPYDGTTASKADIERAGLRFVKGDDVWFSGWFWLEGGSEASLIFLWDLEATALRNSPGRRLFLQSGETVASDLGKWWTSKKFRAVRGAPPFPKDRWVEVKIHLRLSDKDDGRMQVWQNGVKVLDEAGKTLPRARTVYDRLQVGLTANGGRTNAQTLFVDDVVLSNRPI